MRALYQAAPITGIAILALIAAISTIFDWPGAQTTTQGQAETTPSAPTNLQVVVNAAGTGATVSWESGGSGVNGNCPTTLYDLTLYNKTDSSVDDVEHEITAPTTTQTITLTAGHNYDVEVYAYGDSCDDYSDPAALLTITATASTTFPLPTNTPAPTATATNTPDPSASATTTPTATPSTSPSTPINLKVVVNAAGTGATVSWAPGGSGVNGNCPTTRYAFTLYNKTDGSVENVEDEISAPTTTKAITLTAGHEYDVEIHAIGDSCGVYSDSPVVLRFTATASATFPTPTATVTNTPAPTHTPDPSASATSTPTTTDTPTATPTATPRTRPNTPINLKVAVNSDGTSATVSWESGGSGVNGNCATTRYHVTLLVIDDSDNATEVSRERVSAPTTTHTVTLTADQKYNIQVNAYGSSCTGYSALPADLDFTATASTTFPPSPTPTPTVTDTPTITPTPTVTNTPAPTDTPTATNTPDPSASATPTATATATPSVRPNKPINLKVAVNSDGTGATVSWESGGPGVGGSCPATRYDLTLDNLSDNSVDNVLHLVAAPTTTQTVTLTPGQNYNVEVSAYGNSCRGFSESRASLDFTATASTSFTATPTPTVTNTPDPAASDTPTPTATATNTPDPAASDTPTPSITPTPSARPNTPINLKVAVNSDGTSATVSWESGGSGVGGNCPATRYDLRLYNLTDNNVDSVVHLITPPTTTQTVTLTAGQNYNVEVSAYGSSCNGFSESRARLDFTATASTTFTPTASATPTATATATNTPDPAATDTPTPTPTATNTPDPAATDTPTPSITPTPSVRPNEPINIQVAVNSDGTSATVSWESGGPGAGGNCPATRYDLTLINLSDSSVENVSRQITAPATTQTLTLTAGQNYNVQVYARGSSCSEFSEFPANLHFTATASTTFTPSPTATPTSTATATATPTPSIRPNPAAYISVDVAATGTSATVTWRPGGNGVGGNCPTTQYQVVLNVNGAWQIPNNGSVQQPNNGQPTLELTGLTSGDSYIVGVDAFGDVCDTWSLRARLSFTATPSRVFGSATPTPINTPDPTASATPTPTATATATNTPDPSASATPTPVTRIPAATATAKPGTTRPRTATPTARTGTTRPRTSTPTAVTRRYPVSRIEPSTRDETVISAGNKITLRVMPYGQQNMMDNRLSAGRGLTWKQGSITLTDDDKRTPWTIRYTAPSSPGTYRVTASLTDCTPTSEARRATSCSAEFTIRVRRPAPGQTDPSTPVNPPGNIPALIPDSRGNQYGVFTPVDGGTFDSGEGYSIVAEAGVIPNGEFIGVRMSDQGTASNVGMTHHRYTLGGNIYAISAVDSGGTIVSSYILDKAATVCIPLPVELRSKLSDVALVAINNDDTLTILSSSVRLNSSGDTMVCGSLSSLPAQIAVGSAGSPAAIPAPTPEPSPLPPETGGATPASNSIIWVLILGSAIAIFGSTLLIARRRESAKN